MTDYKNRCGSCQWLKKKTDKLAGDCLKRWFAPNYGRGKCRDYQYNANAFCECGTFILPEWNYCAICGEGVTWEKK